MIVDYISIVNSIHDTLKGNDLFNPEAASNQRLINQLLKTRFIPGPPFPVLSIKIADSHDEYRTIGYTPWLRLSINLTVWCSLPSDKSTSRIAADLSLPSTGRGDWHSEQELLYIQSKLEEWIRGDETSAGITRRALGCDSVSGLNIHIALRPETKFGTKTVGNIKLRYAESLIVFSPARIT